MATIDMRVDAYGVDPQFPVDEQRRIRGVGEGVESRVVHARRMGHRVVRTWTLQWDATGEGQDYLVRQAFTAAGRHAALNFIPPDGGGIVEVSFVGDLDIERTSATSWKFTVDIEELIR